MFRKNQRINMSSPNLDTTLKSNPFSIDTPGAKSIAKRVFNGFAITAVVIGAIALVAGAVALAAAGALFAPPVAAAIGLTGLGLIAVQASVIYVGLSIASFGLTFMTIGAGANIFATKFISSEKNTDAVA
jgi:hypothetical protein